MKFTYGLWKCLDQHKWNFAFEFRTKLKAYIFSTILSSLYMCVSVHVFSNCIIYCNLLIYFSACVWIDHMHMTSQKGAPTCWGSNEALPRAPSPSMQPGGQPLHAIPPGWPGPAHWLRGWAPTRSASTTRARSATSLDPQHGVVVMETWRQCIRSILSHFDLERAPHWPVVLKTMLCLSLLYLQPKETKPPFLGVG